MNTQSAYEEVRRELAFLLMKDGAVLTLTSAHPSIVVRRERTHGVERGFRWKLHERRPDAPLSPLKFNLRTPQNPNPGPLTEGMIDRAGRCMRNVQLHIAKWPCDAVVGVPNAGDPFAKKLAWLAGIPQILLHKHTHGETRYISSLKSALPAGVLKVLLVDDVITLAESKREAILNLRATGLEVVGVIVLIDHEMGGREELAKLGCELYAVFTCSELLNWYVESGKVTQGVQTDFHAFRAALQT